MTGFSKRGTFNILPAELLSNAQTDDKVIVMSGFEDTGVYTFEFPTPQKIDNHGDNISLFKNEDTILMLPQSFSSNTNAKLIVTYSISDSGDRLQGTLPLKNMKWEPGQSYNYNFTVSRSGLKLDDIILTPWSVSDMSFDAVIE